MATYNTNATTCLFYINSPGRNMNITTKNINPTIYPLVLSLPLLLSKYLLLCL